MSRLIGTLSLLLVGTLVLVACGLVPLPEPVELDTAFGFGDGIAVELEAVEDAVEDAVAEVGLASLATTFATTFNETFVVDGAEIPPVLRTLVRIKSVFETITLDASITVGTVAATDFPATLTVSDATLSGLQVYRGTSRIVGPLGFSGIEGESIEYARFGECSAATACIYTATFPVDLLELRVAGSSARNLATAITDGGSFRVEGTFAIEVAPGLPEDATISAVIVGTGAFVE